MESVQSKTQVSDIGDCNTAAIKTMNYLAQLQTLGLLGYYPTPFGAPMNNGWPLGMGNVDPAIPVPGKEKPLTGSGLDTLAMMGLEYLKTLGPVPLPSLPLPSEVPNSGIPTPESDYRQPPDLTQDAPVDLSKKRALPSEKPTPQETHPVETDGTPPPVPSPRPDTATGIQEGLTRAMSPDGVPVDMVFSRTNTPLSVPENQVAEETARLQDIADKLGLDPSDCDKVTGNDSESDDRRLLHYRIRQKRQTLQDMTRPLKQWLYHHRDNPYPSKSEKQMLASQSQMTLTQVSNWFANARRRLKNTVKGSEMTWARRIKLYNNCLEGNQERLSISSEDEGSLKGSEMEGFQKPGQPDEVALPLKLAQSPQAATQIEEMDSTSNGGPNAGEEEQQPELQTAPCEASNCLFSPPLSCPPCGSTSTTSTPQQPERPAEDFCPSPTKSPLPAGLHGTSYGNDSCSEHCSIPAKYKNSILHRYLNDSFQYQANLAEMNNNAANTRNTATGVDQSRHRNPSGSLSSHDFEDISLSSRSTPVKEHQMMEESHDEYEEFSRCWHDIAHRAEEDLHWKEISAAMGLTTLARSRHSSAPLHSSSN